MKKTYIDNNNILMRNTAEDLIKLINQESSWDSLLGIKIMGAFDFRDNFKEIGEIHQVSRVGGNVEIRVLLDKKRQQEIFK